MIEVIHNWLARHPITTNILVGLVLIPLSLYAKEVRGFLETPPQRLGAWWRKARLKAAVRTSVQLQRARENNYYFAYRCFRICVIMIGCFSVLLLYIALSVTNILYPVPLDRQVSPLIAVRAIKTLVVISSYTAVFATYSLLAFLTSMANYDSRQDKLALRIAGLTTQISNDPKVNGSNLFEASVRSLRSPTHSQSPPDGFAPGSQVRHPTYGQGTIMRREGEGNDTKLTIQFQRHGIKKLVQKFAQLERI